ncbi:hypothetical protein AZE42_12334 [Rhizopogon vesiculosus]|uniref:Uncharacterized protein n=1 Tax=Rhizopogon vesiculosus TaxID=180088 RepID=A0A1J8QP28_9AGAM|nr:hypothetical protein AZE42_12334 [Rhizopogon vesiculosus]
MPKFYTWVHLHFLSNDKLALPAFQARFNGSDELFTVNVFEMYRSDIDI